MICPVHNAKTDRHTEYIFSTATTISCSEAYELLLQHTYTQLSQRLFLIYQLFSMSLGVQNKLKINIWFNLSLLIANPPNLDVPNHTLSRTHPYNSIILRDFSDRQVLCGTVSKCHLSWWMMREMASNRTAFFALECWTFLDLGGSWALLRIVSRHSVRRLRMAASSATTKCSFYCILAFTLTIINIISLSMIKKLIILLSHAPEQLQP